MTNSQHSKWSLAAVKHIVKTRLARKASQALQDLSVKSWQIALGETSVSPKAYFLPNQLDRVTGWAFSDQHPASAMAGSEVSHGATRGFMIKDVWLIDGALYKNDAHLWLNPRSSWWPTVHVEREIERGALYCTAMGNKYFGQWLMDDCVTYGLASAEGMPITTAQAVNMHTLGYEELLGMSPTRLGNAFIRELIIFDDVGQNANKHHRFRDMNHKLYSSFNGATHPGVFILRGGTGELRLLHNEIELAEHLRDRRGFRILDPSKVDVQTIIATCAGAKTVIGIEGSGLIHGILALQAGGSLLTLQPPNRFVRVYKDLTDRDHQYFGFVVGRAEGKGFAIDEKEIELTLDLFPD